MIRITLAGAPMGKQRVRFSRATGRAFTPERTVNYESRLAAAGQDAMKGAPPMDGPLAVDMKVYMAIAESKPKRWKAAALAGVERPTKKPDLDNFAKMLDALNLIVWIDDSQIVQLQTAKFYSDAPRLEIAVRQLNEPTEGIFS